MQHSFGDIGLEFDRFIDKNAKGQQYFQGPFGISIGYDRRIYIADDLSHKIFIFDTSHDLLKTVGQKGKGGGEFA